MSRSVSIAFLFFVLAACSNSLDIDALETAAARGDVHAQIKLADLYFVGNGVPFNQKQSVFWFQKAAAQGHQYAFYRLGQAHEFGYGVVPDIQLAFDYYRKSALKDAAHAQDTLARLYASGALGRKDFVESHKWQLLSSRHNGLMWRATDYGAAAFLSGEQKTAAERAAAELVQSFNQN